MKAAEVFHIPDHGALPAFDEDGRPVGPLRFQAARPRRANLYDLLHAEGLDDGDAAVLAAILGGRDGAAAEAGLDGPHEGALHTTAGDGEADHAAAINDHHADLVVPVQELPRPRRRGAAWVRGGRAVLFVGALGAYNLVACFVGSALFQQLCVFVPGLMEVGYAMMAAIWIFAVYILAVPLHRQQ